MHHLRPALLSILVSAIAALPAAPALAQAPDCPCSVYAPNDAPADANALVDSPVEVGMKFRSSEDGFITALRFYKQANNTGTHVGHLWSAAGTQLAEATFTNESASGWQQVALPTPIAIAANTTYIASYHAGSGRFAWVPGSFSSAITRPPLTGLADGTDGGNGVYRYGATSAFPDQSYGATSYWVDAVFDRTAADTSGPTITAAAPSDGASDVPLSTTPSATFNEAIAPATLTASSFTLIDGTSTVPATVAYDSATLKATLTPSAPLALGRTFTATVKGGASGVKDAAGNALATDYTWSFSTSVACPCTVFAPTAGPAGAAQGSQPVEVGMMFTAADDGFITSLRFYKQPGNSGVHTGHLWTAAGTQLADVTFAAETPSGWQEEVLPQPIAITKDTTYVVSYYSPTGNIAFDPGFFSSDVKRGPLTAPGGIAGGNGVYAYGTVPNFPSATFNNTNYWVDASFAYTQPPDTRPPQIKTVTPASGQSAVPTGSLVTVTFDEALDPFTVNAGSIVLRNGAGDPIVGTVTYDAATRKATLAPQSPLPLGNSYTATVKSGTAGITDTAGNSLPDDYNWTFSTSDNCPCTVFAPAAAPAGDAVHDQPIEIGMKFHPLEDGYITSLRFYKQPNNTGIHTGHLWSGTGQLLATAKFINETASGWQQVDIPNPVAVTANTTYITSYYSSSGYFAFDGQFFSTAKSRPPMVGLANGADGGNGVYKYGASSFPTDTFNATNYWVDAAFERTIPPDTRGPNVTESEPVASASEVDRNANISASFDEQLDPASVTDATFTLRDANDALVPSTVTYDAQTRTARLDPQAALALTASYTVQLKGGSGGVSDTSGNPLTADKTWTFTTAGLAPGEGPGGPILVATSPGDKFGRYYAEILRSEGLNAFDVVEGPLTATQLSGHDTVVLAAPAVTDAEVTLLTNWVQGGGNLVAMRPDKKLAALLGLTDTGATLSNAYLKVDTATAAGAGIEGQTLQFHDTADRYSLSGGASAIATLYSDAATATANPAVTMHEVGSAGGQAVTFTYDLARSIVYTRQGNPAWAGQKRDAKPGGIRATDMFFGAKVGDVQPDWVDPAKLDVPQADEQQRLLANLITQINLDRAPLPRFWYLPRGEKAAVVLTGDDHAVSGTAAYFDRLKSSSPAGCSVADWECVRATSYVYPDTALTDAQVAGYQNDGFEVALHLNTGCQDWTPTSLNSMLASQLATFAGTFPSARPPATNRTHCIIWSDWASQPKIERAQGIRFDTNYYYAAEPGWLKKPGLLTGSGFPQRFADVDGALIDVYQSMTQVSDELENELPTATQVHTLLDDALGSKAYYGAFNVILHSDFGDHARLNDAVADAQERGVPLVTSAQMLDWLDGRNGSSFADVAYSAGNLTFSVVTNAKARGLEAMLPRQGAAGPLSRITRNGSPIPHSTRTVKGVQYEVFKAAAGSYTATYATDSLAPDISAVAAVADAEGRATVAWTTDEPATSHVEYGRTTNLGYEASASAFVNEHSIELSGLSPTTTYRFRVGSTDAAGNASISPVAASSPSTFVTPAGAIVDTRTSEFAAGAMANTNVGASMAGNDGEVQLQPTVGEEFEGSTVPDGWTVAPWFAGGSSTVSSGGLYADGAAAYPSALYTAGRVLEFSATFQPVNNQAVGFGQTLSNYPLAAFTSGDSGDPFGVYASSGADEATHSNTALPNVSLNVPHRFKIVWNAANVQFYVDGALVATHTVTIDAEMRPVVSDYSLFGAGVRAHWIRQGAYSTNGLFTSRVLDSGPGTAHIWQTLTAGRTVPNSTSIAFQTRSGGTATPDTTWSGWQTVAADGAIASPAARFIQYRATLASATGFDTPTLDRVQIGFGAGTDRAPVEGSVTLAPAAPNTTQTVAATPSAFSDPDGDPLTYHYEWLRNGTPIAGATSASLNLALAGNGDRGDTIKVRVYATDGRGAASDVAVASVVVANTAPTAGSATIAPATPSSNDTVKATASGFADIDNDTLTYRYQWLKNGTPIAGATNRTLNLALAGNGDLGDVIAVDVAAVDSSNAASPNVRATKTITGTNSTPIEGTVALSPTAPRTDQTLTATPSGYSDPDGDPITYGYIWLRNGAVIGGSTTNTLDLSQAGKGDRGDTIRVEVTATDNHGATSDASDATVTVANTTPTSGSVSIKPSAPATNDTLTAVPKDFADIDGDALSYTYQWYRNGSAIAGEIGRSLDLSKAGNGAINDAIAVDVRALDGNGATSIAARGTTTIVSTQTNPVASFGFEEAAGTSVIDQTGPNDGKLDNGTARTNTGRFGRAVSFDAEDDIVTIPDNPSLQLSVGMTLEAWVRPSAITDWRTIIFKEANGGLSYALYSNDDNDRPSTRLALGGDVGTAGTTDLPPNQWSHLAATYDGTTMRLFVNGTQVGSAPGPVDTELLQGSGPLTFGANRVFDVERYRGLIDEVRIYNRALSSTEITTDMGNPVVPSTPPPPSNTTPAAIGSYSAVQTWPIVPVHLSMTSDGLVAAWDGFDAALNSERRYIPATGSFTQIPSGRNLFCAGHITLDDGRLLVAGGHINAYEGTKDTNLFTPATSSWARGQDMARARWYPTVTALPDGRVFTISGDGVTLDEPNQSVPLTDASNSIPEIYNPANDTWTTVDSAARRMPLYPFMFVLPNGKLFDAGPDTMTRTLDLQTGQWTNVGTSPIDGHSAVMYRPGKILKTGTWSDPEFPGRSTTNRAAVIDMTVANPAWREVAPMEYRRSFHTLTVLPDGKVLASGGQTSTDGVDERTGILASEIWDPATDTWTTVASHRRPRLYHSNSLLLPDGRVMLAGGGAFGNAKDEKSAEFYSPPYLFNGPRPTVTSAPSTINYGQTFTVQTPDAGQITSVSLIKLGSATHNLDMDQRFMNLPVTATSGSVTITGPSDANTAPPGYYSVYLLNSAGVPSTGQIVKVKSAGDTTRPSVTVEQAAAQSDPANTTPITFTVTFSEPVTGFTASDLARGGTSSGGAVTVTGSGASYNVAVTGAISNGTISFTVPAGAAQDGAGNTNLPSTSVDNTVTYTDNVAPTVTLTTPVNDSTTLNTTPTLSGAAGNASGDSNIVTVRIYNGSGTGGSITQTLTPTRSSTSWTTTAATLSAGTYTAQATQTDNAGNTGASAANTFTVDTRPSVTVEQRSGQADPTNALPIRYTVTFDEPVTGFDATDLSRGGTSSGGTVTVTGSGTTYDISVTGPPTNGTISFTVPAGRATDATGNTNTASTSVDNTVTYDTAAPTVTVTAPGNGSTTLNTTPTLSGAAGNASGDSNIVTVRIYNGSGTGGSVAQTFTPTRSSTSWTTTAATLSAGTYTAQATQTDNAGNTGTSAANTFTVDTRPSVTVEQRSGQADPTNALPIRYTVTFNEFVTGFTASDLARGGTSSGGTVTVTGSGTTYDISVTGTPTNGTISFTVPAGRATDATGNTNTASTSVDNTVTYDTTAPAVTVTAPANGSTTNNTSPTLSGAAGNATGDLNTVTVRIYNGSGTAGSVAQTLTPTRSSTSWTTTAAALPQGAYTVQATQTDSAGNTGTSNARAFTVDTAAPTLSAVAMLDADADGKVDRVRATFSETVAATTATAPWTLTSTPSAGSLSSVSSATNVVTLVLNEGAGAADTTVGAFRVALAANAAGVRDAAGNVASFGTTTPADLAAPVLMTVTTTAGSQQNRMQSGDTLVETFSEPLLPSSVPNNLTVTEQRAILNATLTIPGFIQSSSISTGYLAASNSSGAAPVPTPTLSNANRTITLTLGGITTTGSGVATGSGGASIVPNAALTDPAGNAAATTARTANPLF